MAFFLSVLPKQADSIINLRTKTLLVNTFLFQSGISVTRGGSWDRGGWREGGLLGVGGLGGSTYLLKDVIQPLCPVLEVHMQFPGIAYLSVNGALCRNPEITTSAAAQGDEIGGVCSRVPYSLSPFNCINLCFAPFQTWRFCHQARHQDIA